jgi:hypothetical protein
MINKPHWQFETLGDCLNRTDISEAQPVRHFVAHDARVPHLAEHDFLGAGHDAHTVTA